MTVIESHVRGSSRKFKSFQALLRCPSCQSSKLSVNEDASDMDCLSCGSRYPISYGRPVLLQPDNDVFCLQDYSLTKSSSTHKVRIWKKIIPDPSVNLASQRLLSEVRKLLEIKAAALVLVVGCGCQRQWLDHRLGSSSSIQIVYTDIDIAADVDLFCDGHDLPFVDDVFDAVVTTAVLEHVMYPERVAAEIIRVLKVGGLLYSELPFMQQVHEGAYDFTRYTMSGHRRLFNRISEIESGMVAGPGTVLVWSIEHFVIAFIGRSRLRNIAKAIIRIFFGWFKYFDLLLVNKPAALDGASCTYLLGIKSDDHVPDSEIIERYSGAQTLRHS